MTSLEGKIVLVTGASAGIGFSIAETLVKRGAKVIAAARNIEKILDLQKRLQLESQTEITLVAVKTDMTQETEVLALFKEVADTFGKLDVLVNNAGTSGISDGLLDGDMKGWRAVVDLNVLGLTLATREAVKLMITSDGPLRGHIININSITGHYVPNWPMLHFYAGSKHMVTALTEGVRKCVQAQNIRVTSISPGVTQTEILERSQGKEAAEQFYSQYKVLDAKDIANAVVYVLTAPPHVNIDELTITPLLQPAL